MHRRVLLSERIEDTEDLKRWMYNRDWNITGEYPPDEDTDQPYEIAWMDRPGDTFVHYIEDHIAGVPYFVVNGPGTAEAIALLRGRFPQQVPDDRVLGAPDADPAGRAKQAVWAGLLVGATEHADAIRQRLTAFAGDPSAEVRRAAVLAMAYTNDRAWIPTLDGLARTDPDESVRAEARRLSAGLSLHAP